MDSAEQSSDKPDLLGLVRWQIYRACVQTFFAIRFGPEYLRTKASLLSRITTHKPFRLDQGAELELHLLTCHRDIYLCLWALASWYGIGERQDRLCIHDDGTLTEIDRTHLLRLFPGCRIITRREADRVASVFLGDFPNIRCFRRLHKLAPKLLDTYLFAHTKRIILMDSDVFTFSSMLDIESFIPDSGNIFMGDYQLAFSVGRSAFEQLNALGAHIPLNSGFGILELLTIRLERIESILKTYPELMRHVWGEQTLFAILSSDSLVRQFPNDFVVARGRGISGVRLKHYVSLARGFAYVEGVRALTKALFDT